MINIKLLLDTIRHTIQFLFLFLINYKKRKINFYMENY